MKKRTYVVTHETFHRQPYGMPGIAIREKSTDALNVFFPSKLENDGDVELINVNILLHIQNLVNTYGATIEWNLSEYAE